MNWVSGHPEWVAMGVVAFLLLLSNMAAHVRIGRLSSELDQARDATERVRHGLRAEKKKIHNRIDEVHVRVSKAGSRIDNLTGKSRPVPPAAHAATDDDPGDDEIEEMAAVAAVEELFVPSAPRPKLPPPPIDDDDDDIEAMNLLRRASVRQLENSPVAVN